MNIYAYKNINLSKCDTLNNVDWSRKSNKLFSKLHSISSYLAMFCPALPKYFIDKYSNENDIVMDSFSGRGTTALVCRESNRQFIGTDLNPYAYVLTKFKISSNLKLKNILNRVSILENEFKNNREKITKEISFDKYNDLSHFYSKNVLTQLIFLRNKLGKNWKKLNKVDNAILAISLGLMHGRTRKDNSTMYFSIDMPNTISMSPNYVRRYASDHNLKCPDLNIFENIKNRLISKYDEKILDLYYSGKILFADATKNNKKIKDNSVSLVITSPPYLSIVDYRLSNWLKLWLLGYEKASLNDDIPLSDKLKYDEYIIFIKNYLNSIHSKLKNGAKVCLVVGDVHDNASIENVWKEIEKEVKYKFVEIYYDQNYLQQNKVTNMLNSKKGKATIIEKVLVLEKYEN
ncbi:MAG: site-specific DNA-methyltransferase [Ureaplasma sp.]|nr:site-specific DNA-methyltransferase [Ureaplasma sp.]